METNNPVDTKIPNSLAAVWTMMLPGLGQMMKGQVMPGVIWAIGTAGGYYAFFWPGLVIHTLCILDAAFNKGAESWLSLETWPKRIGFLAMVGALIFYVYYRNF